VVNEISNEVMSHHSLYQDLGLSAKEREDFAENKKGREL
jgi:hypothetical protein